jgi:hypothetical protein
MQGKSLWIGRWQSNPSNKLKIFNVAVGINRYRAGINKMKAEYDFSERPAAAMLTLTDS